MVSRVWPGFWRSEKGTGLHCISNQSRMGLTTYRGPSAGRPFAGLLGVFEPSGELFASILVVFETEGVA
jgi:hypothetical protein